MQATAERAEKLARDHEYVLFGIPQDRTNNGLIGTMADMKDSFDSAVRDMRSSTNRVLGGIVIAVAIDVIVRAVLGQ